MNTLIDHNLPTPKVHLTASAHPREVIELLPRRPDQKPSMRQYAEGHEDYFNLLPVLRPHDPLLYLKTKESELIMKMLAVAIRENTPSLIKSLPAGDFERVILALADPVGGHEGSEILLAHWGQGFSSPVHGHAPGLLHEEILSGRMLVHTYRHVATGVVRPLRSGVATVGTLVSKYSAPDPSGPRMGLVHNFTALEPSTSMHFVPEHTRDGRDNSFKVEYFDELDVTSVRQIDGEAGRLLQPGEVGLVRSTNVPEYGDHFIVITGPIILKPHGLRPMDVEVKAGPVASALLDQFKPLHDGLLLLKLDKAATKRFFEFHGITMAGERMVVFPQA